MPSTLTIRDLEHESVEILREVVTCAQRREAWNLYSTHIHPGQSLLVLPTDLALLVDGLQAERELGITIDVAFRFFATDQLKFVVVDTLGLYAKARRGELKKFAGVDNPYEAPLAPDVHLQTANA